MSASNEYPVLQIGAVVSDSSISKFRIVQGDTTNTTNTTMVVAAATGETTLPVGVTYEATAAANRRCGITMGGIANVEVNGSGTAIDIGTRIVATSGGVGVANSTPDATDQYAIGIALAPSSASGDIIPVLIAPHLIVKGAS
jgi:hypothetical protein